MALNVSPAELGEDLSRISKALWSTFQLTANVSKGDSHQTHDLKRLKEVVRTNDSSEPKARWELARLARRGAERAKVHVGVKVERLVDENEDDPEADPVGIVEDASFESLCRVGGSVEGEAEENAIDTPVVQAAM
jgi:hypothetical protein